MDVQFDEMEVAFLQEYSTLHPLPLLRKLNTLPNTSAGFLQLNGILGKQGASFSWENLREDAYSDKYGI